MASSRYDNAGLGMLADEELVELCRRGHSGAAAEIYRRYHPAMLRLCRCITGADDEARDVVHDGFVIVFSRLGSLRQGGSLGGWMARIMANLARRQVAERRRRQRAEAGGEVGQGGGEASADVPLDVLMAMIDSLPDAYGRVFRLSVLDGLGHDDISRIVGIKPKSSASNLARARAMLRRMIAEWRRAAGLAVVVALALLPAVVSRRPATPPPGFGGMAAGGGSAPGGLSPAKPGGGRVGHAGQSGDGSGVASAPAAYRPEASRMALCRLNPVAVAAPRPAAERPAVRHLPLQAPLFTASRATLPAPVPQGSWRPALSLGCSTASAAASLLASAVGSAVLPGIGSATRGDLSTWEGLNEYITYTPPEGMDPIEREALMHISMMNSGAIVTRRSYARPLTAGIAASWQLAPRFALESGLRLTLMRSEAVTGSSDSTNITRRDRALYLGVPLSATFTLAGRGPLRLYVSAGAAVDVPVWHSAAIDYNIDNKLFFTRNSVPGKPAVQFSVGAGVGVGYEIAPHTELFFAPQANFYLPAGGSPTLWQHRRLQLSWPLGIRLRY